MIKLVKLECPNCGGKLEPMGEEMAKCPHCEMTFLIDEGQPENVIHIHEAEKKTSGGTILIVSLLVIVAMFIGAVILILPMMLQEAENSGQSLKQVLTEEEKIEFSSSFYKELVAQVYGTAHENVTKEQLSELTYLAVSAGEGMEKVEYRLGDGPMQELSFPTNLRRDNMDLSNFPNLKGIYLPYGSIPEMILPDFTQLSELESENSPEELAMNLPSPEKLTKLICHRTVSMAGINAFENLTYLEIDYYEAKDIRAVGSLKKLTTLIIESGDEITDFGALHALDKMKVLYLDSNQLKDISFIEDMEQLEEFTLKKSKVINLMPLSGKTMMRQLTLENNYEVKDYSPVSTLTNLEVLNLDLCTDGEMPDAHNWGKLTELSVSGAESLQFLSQLPTLNKLYISSAGSQDFEVLASLSQLTELSIGRINGEINSLDALASLTALEKLDISVMTIYGNIEDVFAIPSLTELNINDCSFGLDFDRIQENTSLKYLYMNRVCLWQDIQVYQDGIVTYLDYDEVDLADHIDFVSKFPNLEKLYLQGNKLTDVTFAESLPQLTHLDVTNNYITDLRPLQNLTRLETVWCGQNSISQGTDLGEDVVVILDNEAEEKAWWK